MGPTERAKVLLWGQSPETREERKLLMKIDASVLSFLCASSSPPLHFPLTRLQA